MFEGDFAAMCLEILSIVSEWGDEHHIKHVQMRSENPHRRERTFCTRIVANLKTKKNKKKAKPINANPKAK